MELTNNRSIDPPLMAGKPLVGSALDLMRDRLAFFIGLAKLNSVVLFRMFHLPIYRPGVVHVVLKERNR